MNIVCFDEDEIRELYEYLFNNKDSVIRYIDVRSLSFSEARALLEACEKIEREYKKETVENEI